MDSCRKIILRITVAAALGLAAIAGGAQPDWSVASNEFEFTMTVTGIGQIQCFESLDTNDVVAAFVGDEVRGVQRFRDDFDGHHFAFMIVYDNAFSGSPVHFKIYDASADTIYDALNTLVFQENQNYGSTENPFVFQTLPGIHQIIKSPDEIPATAGVMEVISTLTAIDENGQVADVTYSWINDDLGTDNFRFLLQNNQMLLQQNASGIEGDLLNLHLVATPQNGCPLDDPFHFTVSGTTAISESPGSILQMNVYPNPSQGIIHWDVPLSNALLEVYDVMGRKVYIVKVDDEQQADLSKLPNGLYRLLWHTSSIVYSASCLRSN